MPGLRRKNLIASRRRVDDEGEEEGGPDVAELEDDSLSEGSVISDEDDVAEGDEDDNTNSPSVASPDLRKNGSNGHAKPINGEAKSSNNAPTAVQKSEHLQTLANGTSDTDLMLNGLKNSDHNGAVKEVHYEDLQEKPDIAENTEPPFTGKGTAHMDQQQETSLERRRREHEEYKSKRDSDPAFVPNRGAFFMHDHRHAGPAANGFRPFGRGRGRGRAGIGGPFAPMKYVEMFHS